MSLKEKTRCTHRRAASNPGGFQLGGGTVEKISDKSQRAGRVRRDIVSRQLREVSSGLQFRLSKPERSAGPQYDPLGSRDRATLGAIGQAEFTSQASCAPRVLRHTGETALGLPDAENAQRLAYEIIERLVKR